MENAGKNNLLPVIASFKLAKACLLFAFAFGLHDLWRGDIPTILEHWMRDIRIDPDDQLAQTFLAKVTGMPKTRLHELGIGLFCYGMMFGVEGTGLMLRKRWAEYLTVVTTTTFLPLEIYELVAKPERKAIKGVLLIINLVVLAYLIWNLVMTGRDEQEQSRNSPKQSNTSKPTDVGPNIV